MRSPMRSCLVVIVGCRLLLRNKYSFLKATYIKLPKLKNCVNLCYYSILMRKVNITARLEGYATNFDMGGNVPVSNSISATNEAINSYYLGEGG